MNDEKLILLVRNYEELYNTSAQKYNDHIHKNKLWRKIGKQLNKAGPECKTRWVSLRDQFRKVLRKKKVKFEQGATNVKKWKYEDAFTFLLPFVKERQNLSNFDVDSDSNDSRLTVTTEEQNNREQKYFDEQDNKNANIECHSSVILKNVEPSRNNDIETENVNPIDSFFMAISATVKQFSPYYQNIVKSKIFSVVSELEMAHIVNKENSQLNPEQEEILGNNQNIVIKQSPASTPIPSPTTSETSYLTYFEQISTAYNNI